MKRKDKFILLRKAILKRIEKDDLSFMTPGEVTSDYFDFIFSITLKSKQPTPFFVFSQSIGESKLINKCVCWNVKSLFKKCKVTDMILHAIALPQGVDIFYFNINQVKRYLSCQN